MSPDRKRPLLRLADDLTVLTRLIHGAGATRRSELEPMPPDGLYGSLSELRTALLAGRVDRAGALAIYRYHPATEAAWSRLPPTGGSPSTERQFRVTSRRRRFAGASWAFTTT